MMSLFSFLKKKKKTLPEVKWKDITIAKHKAILDLFNREDDEMLLLYGLAEIIYGNDINNMRISEANDLVNTLSFINQRPKPATAKSHYVLNGHKYKTTLNMQNINTSQFIDFQQMADKSGEMPAEFLSIILVPDGHKYNDGYCLEDVVKDIENYMSIEDAYGLSAFFFNLLQISIQRSIRKLKKLEKAAAKEGLMTKAQLEALKEIRKKLESNDGLKQWML